MLTPREIVSPTARFRSPERLARSFPALNVSGDVPADG